MIDILDEIVTIQLLHNERSMHQGNGTALRSSESYSQSSSLSSSTVLISLGLPGVLLVAPLTTSYEASLPACDWPSCDLLGSAGFRPPAVPLASVGTDFPSVVVDREALGVLDSSSESSSQPTSSSAFDVAPWYVNTGS